MNYKFLFLTVGLFINANYANAKHWTSGCSTHPEHNKCKADEHKCDSCVGAHHSNAICCCNKGENIGHWSEPVKVKDIQDKVTLEKCE